MRRTLRSCAILMGSLSAASCVSLSTQTEVSIWSYDQTTEINVAVPIAGVGFNWHGGGWYNVSDEYKLSTPRGKPSISAGDIVLKLNDAPLTLDASSSVSIAWTNPCTVTLNLRDAQGKPYKFNGVYKTGSFSCQK